MMHDPHAHAPGESSTTPRATRVTEFERLLLEQPGVDDCAVLPREDASGEKLLVAYVVPAAHSPFSASDVKRRVAATQVSLPAPELYVELRALPLTPAGDVDEVALCDIEVIDDRLVGRWEQELREVDGVTDVAVLADERQERVPPRHMADLLPEWDEITTDDAGAVAPNASSPELASKAARLAHADGGPLDIPADAPRTLTDALLRTAAQSGERCIRIVQANTSATTMTYADLLARARRILSGLTRMGLRPGDSAILQVPDLEEHFPTFWACLLGGIKPVTVAVPPAHDPKNAVTRKLVNAWTLLGRPAILAGERVAASVRSLESALDMTGLRVAVIDELAANPPAGRVHPAAPEDVAFYQLSSGSTGVSKCIQITHAGVVSYIHGNNKVLAFSPSDVTLNWLPMDHVVPLLSYHIKDVYIGIEQVQLPGPMVLANPLCWLDYIEQYGVTHTWAPNFGFKMLADALGEARDRRWDLSRVKAFVNAGEQVTQPVVRTFLERVAPFGAGPATMQPAFGMAEVCTIVTCDSQFDGVTGIHRVAKETLQGVLRPAAGNEPAVVFVDCGPATPGVQMRVVDRANHLLPEDTIGRIQLKGRVVTPGYLNNPPANEEAMVGEGWFNSGDLGFIHGGRLAITGREKELIIVNGANYYCYEIEDVAAGIPGVLPTYAAACGIEDAATGTEALAFFFVRDESAAVDLIDVVKSVRRTLASQIGLSPRFVVPVDRDEFPKTTSGKIQRGHLKQALLAGRFRHVLRDLDVRLENASTVPDWFYRPIWKRRQLTGSVRSTGGTRLLFLDGDGLGERVRAAWSAAGARCVTVTYGSAFLEGADDRYQIDPISLEDMVRLLREIGGSPEIVHFWAAGRLAADSDDFSSLDEALARGAYSLVALVRALATIGGDRPTRLTIVSTHTFAVLPDDRVSPDRGTLPALVRTIAAEIPWLTCRLVEVEPQDQGQAARAVEAECAATASERVIAYRGGDRFVPRLEKLGLASQPLAPRPFIDGGAYLLSGGLGGVGTEVAKFLLTRFRARLLIVGRTALGPAADSQAQTSAEASARASTLRELGRLPGEVSYVQADVADAPKLLAAVEEVTARWGTALDGVVHLAGLFHEQPLTGESVGGLAEALRPKVYGTLALYRLLRDRPGSVFVTFSSAYGYLGGFGAGAYAAANGFLDAFAVSRHTRSGVRCHSIGWALWDDIGMSRGYRVEEAVRARGFRLMSRTQALNSLTAALRRDVPHLIVGLDPTGRAIRSQIDGLDRRARQLTAYCQGGAAAAISARAGTARVGDRFGQASECVVRAVEMLPRTADGVVDRRALAGPLRVARVESVAPASDVERMVAGVWRLALNQDAVGIHDNFFDLGGTSLLAGQIAGRLRDVLQRNVDVNTMFQFPTIAAQAAHLSGGATADAATVADSQSRGAARRASARRLRRAIPSP